MLDNTFTSVRAPTRNRIEVTRVPTHSRFDVLQLDLPGPAVPVPADRTPVVVRFTHADGHAVDVPGFWDGGDRYVVRFAPELEGGWTWESVSETAELAGRSGHLDIGPPAAGAHGPVRVAGTFHFAHADGTPFRPVGGTVYNWIHQAEPLYSETVRAIAEAGFNKLRFLVFRRRAVMSSTSPSCCPSSGEPTADGTCRGPSSRSSAGSTSRCGCCTSAASRPTC
jgi:Domain of unknown function (DUF5060)